MLIDSYSAGYLSQSVPKRVTLSGSYAATFTGVHTLDIQNSRSATQVDCYNRIDNIVIAPQNPDLILEEWNIGVYSGGSVQMTLDAGPAHAGAHYVVAASFGSFPGFTMSGVNVPLNMDMLFNYSRTHTNTPMFQNTMGVLDANGQATAKFDTRGSIDPSYLGTTFTFAFVLLSGPMQLPVTYASYPVLVNFINYS